MILEKPTAVSKMNSTEPMNDTQLADLILNCYFHPEETNSQTTDVRQLVEELADLAPDPTRYRDLLVSAVDSDEALRELAELNRKAVSRYIDEALEFKTGPRPGEAVLAP
jgi:hypothetical protein